MATVKQVLEALQKLPPKEQEQELKIWLPGSSISVGDLDGNPRPFAYRKGSGPVCVILEGNVDPGSALARD